MGYGLSGQGDSHDANLYTLPVDLYGAQRAAFGVPGLVFAMEGFQPVLLAFALLPLTAYVVLWTFVRVPRLATD